MFHSFVRDFLKPFFFFTLPILAILFFIIFLIASNIDLKKIENDLHVGIVADKEVVNAHKGLFVYSDTRYQIVVKFEYEYHGRKHVCKRNVDVDYDVYISYDIGDEFDTYNPVVKDRKDVLK